MQKLVRLWLRPNRKKDEYVYCLRWTDEHGKEKYSSLGHCDKRKAERQRKEKEIALKRGQVVNQPKRLSELKEDYLERTRTQIESSTADLAKIGMKLMIDALGDRDPNSIRYADCERFQQFCCDRGLAPITVNSRIAGVSRIFCLAGKRGQIESNPFKGFPKLKVPKGKIRIFSSREFDKIIQCVDTILWLARILLGKTGALRRGEILNLTVDDIDFANETITIQPKPETDHTWRWVVKDKDRREVPLVPELTRLLLDLQMELPEGQPYLLLKPERYQFLMSQKEAGKLDDVARRCPENNFTRGWRSIFKRAGVSDAGFHDLRRTCITEWLENGLALHEVTTLAGHSDVRTTMTYYLGLRRGLINKARTASSAGLGTSFSARFSARDQNAQDVQNGESSPKDSSLDGSERYEKGERGDSNPRPLVPQTSALTN